MKSEVVEEILKAIKKLSINDDFRLLSDDETKNTYNDLLNTFVKGGDRRWWWESFSQHSYFVKFPNDKAFLEITKIVPEKSEILWFMVEDDHMPYFPIFEATPEKIEKIIAECFAFEYYIIPKTKNWLLCEDHHDCLHGVGEEIFAILKKY
jgi:hypothetical protein